MMDQAERLQLFLGILDLDDCEFVARHDPRAAHVFRKNRVRIFRTELRSIRSDAARLYRLRASNIAEAGRWPAYAPLLLDTGLSYWAIAKLYTASGLFSLQLPRVINTARSAERVMRFVNQTDFASPSNLPA